MIFVKESFEQFPRIYKLENISNKLINRGKELFFKKNKFIVSPGDTLEGFYFIKEGRVLGVEYLPKGNEKIICILEKSSIFLESNVILNIPAFCYFKTIEDTTVILVSREDLLDLLSHDLNVTLFVIESLSMKFYSNINHINELLYHDAEWKIRNLLATFADNFGEKEGIRIKLNIKISQQFISNLLGINRVTAVRILKKLKIMKLIEQTNGYYYIKDIQRLTDYQTSTPLVFG